MGLLRTKTGGRATEMDIVELQKKVIEFRDARDWAQLKSQRSEVSASEITKLKDLGRSSPKRNTLSKRQKAARKNIPILDPGNWFLESALAE
jgi:hypothetical protein